MTLLFHPIQDISVTLKKNTHLERGIEFTVKFNVLIFFVDLEMEYWLRLQNSIRMCK